jgi:hypothetical protein
MIFSMTGKITPSLEIPQVFKPEYATGTTTDNCSPKVDEI